jgi:putative DNA methylase
MSSGQPKKLIEVALPLPEINDASAYDKMPGIGPHPKGIHHWWARLPLPTARAVLFASVVDDPSAHPEKFRTEAAQTAERERLFDIIRRLMAKRLHEHPQVYAEARREMEKYCDGKLPPVLDPFAGGGSIPLEANRLGFEAHAGDLNPVAVLLNKCNLEIAPRWLDRPPVNPEYSTANERELTRMKGSQDSRSLASIRGSQLLQHEWKGLHGLAADVRYYGKLIRERAQELIGQLYPKAQLPRQLGGGEADVVAWIWARTVASPDPAARGTHVPLMSSYWLCNKGNNKAWLHPIVDRAANTYHFEVRTGEPPNSAAVKSGTKTGKRAKFKCLLTGAPINDVHIKAQGTAGELGWKLIAIVAEGSRTKIYLPASATHEAAAQVEVPADAPNEELDNDPRNIWCSAYGIETFDHLFKARQLKALVTLMHLIRKVREDVLRDAKASGLDQNTAEAYTTAVITLLALALDRCADFNNAMCGWNPSNQKVMHLFGRQAIPMVWDFGEANLMGECVGAWQTCFDYVAECVEILASRASGTGAAQQVDAANAGNGLNGLLVSTDPPYYDNISYAGLSDFFYVWLRRTIGDLYPDLCATVLVPKMPELTAAPERFDGDKEQAKQHFEQGFRQAFTSLRDRMDPRCPLTVYYAFKQEDEESVPADEAEAEGNGVDLTTGWETLLEALSSSCFQVTATWPVRASQQWRMRAMGANALASYIVLACRPRAKDAPQTGRREFMAELKRELPAALRHLRQGNVAPVDFAQAAIGPGMAVFSRFSRVLESSGQSMTVRTALALINQILGEVLTEQEDEFDADTRWALAWFEQKGFAEGEFGDANTLATAKNTAVNGLVDAGILYSGRGKVRLLRPEELDKDWDPANDARLTVWEMTHHLLRVFYVEKQGETATAALMRKLGSRAEVARDLGYRLFRVAEKLHSQDAQAYNALVLAWPDLVRLAGEQPAAAPAQKELI